MIKIIHSDKDLIICEKPPGVPSQGDKDNTENMLDLLRAEHYKGDENGELFLIHRLDRGVGGVMVYACSPHGAKELSKLVSTPGSIEKTYLCIVCGEAKESDTLTDILVKNEKTNTSRVANAKEKKSKYAKEAILEYERLQTIQTEKDGTLSLLKITLKTGRHHQIRVQMSHAGLPLYGDTKYNAAYRNRRGFYYLGLWAYEIRFVHPRKKKPVAYKIPVIDYSITDDEYIKKKYPFTLFDLQQL